LHEKNTALRIATALSPEGDKEATPWGFHGEAEKIKGLFMKRTG